VTDPATACSEETTTRAGPAARRAGVDGSLPAPAAILARFAARRYADDPEARPDWWEPYPLPPTLSALDPVPDTRFLSADGRGGRASGGLFSLDGVHPTTVAYGILAQEIIDVMVRAGVEFRSPNGTVRSGRVSVDFERLLRRDTLVRSPPQNIDSTLAVLGWLDEILDVLRVQWRPGL